MGGVGKMSWWNAFITANLIGIGANFDNCGVGIAYGSQKIKFPHRVNAVVNGVGFCTAFLGAYAGKLISHYFTAEQAGWASCIALACIGLFFWYSGYVHPRISRHTGKVKIQTRPNWKQGALLGLALSFTNVVSAFGGTVSNATTIWTTTAVISMWGYIMIWFGNLIGVGVFARLLGKYSSLVAGFLLILVGVHQVLG
ncbi:hypothetical protein CVV65_12935 [Kyrpidia spormannii]|uniref:Integral membrane protein n=2 Tax=Kyrpidia spormannii TaxID=2055160 RepID=A0A2K8N8R3_9BACL|nr:hypothetical protein CVV65_12935 [Kyrpidia spormannii]